MRRRASRRPRGLVVLARLLQGASAGLLTPQSSGLIQQLFRGAERGKAFGFFGLTVSISAGIGPVLGGAIIALAGEENGWRWLFLVNVPIGLVAMVAIARLVPGQSSTDAARDSRVDVPGALLLGAAVLCLLYPLVSLEGGARLPLLLVAGAPLFLWAFVRWEQRIRRRGHPPLLDVALLRELPGYGNGLAVGALYFTGFTGVFLVLSVFLQEGMDLSPLHTGLLLTPFALGSAVTAPIAGRIVTVIGRRVTVVALVVMMTGVLLVALLVPGRDVGTLGWFLVPALVLAGLGGGGVVNPNFTLSLAEVPPYMGGAAGGALQTGQRIGSSIGAALLITVYQVTASSASTGRALQTALLTALVVLGLALVMAFRALREQGAGQSRSGQP